MSGAFPLLRGLCISCSGLDPSEKIDAHRRIVQLGGSVSSNLTTSVTHVVTKDTSLFCRKYHVSAKVGIPIVSLGFIRECEVEARERNREPGLQLGARGATTEVLRQITERNRFPPFTGCRISSTGFTADLRMEIERLVENANLASTSLFSEHLAHGLSSRPSRGSEQVGGGGLYCGVLTGECTHLIAQSPEGEKFKFAKSRSIPVVSLEWFVQCLRAGARQKEDDYVVEGSGQSAHTTDKNPVATKLQRLKSLDQTMHGTKLTDSSDSCSHGYRKHASAPISEHTLSAASAQSGVPPTIEPVASGDMLQQSGLTSSKAFNHSRADSFDLPLILVEPLKVDSEEDGDVVIVANRPAPPISRLRPPPPRPSRASSVVFESCRIVLSQASLSSARRNEWRSKIVAARGECSSEDRTLPVHATHDAYIPRWTHYVVGDADELCAEDIRVLQLTHITEKLEGRPLVVQCGWLRECWQTGRRAQEATYSIPWPEPNAEPSMGVVKDPGISLARSGSSALTRHTTKPQLGTPSIIGQPLSNSTMENDEFDLLENIGRGYANKRSISSSNSAEDGHPSDMATKHPRRLLGGSAVEPPFTNTSSNSHQVPCNPQTIYTMDYGAYSGGTGSALFTRCVFTSLGLATPAVAKFKQVVRENGGVYIDVFGSFPSITPHQPRSRAQESDLSVDRVLSTLASNIDDTAVTDAYIVIPLRGIDGLAACEAALRRYPSMHIVTECWVDQCVHDSLRYPDYCAIQALSLPYPGLSVGQHIMFRPLKPTPLAGVGSLSLSISGYEGTERDHIGMLAQALGIEYSERLPRKTTHLICRPPFSGQKYERALKWGLQVVDSTWLYSLVAAGQVDSIGTGEESRKVTAHNPTTCSIRQMTTPQTKSTHQSLLLGTPGRTPMDVSLERNIQQALGNNRVRIQVAHSGEHGGNIDVDDATQMSPPHGQTGPLAAAVSGNDVCLATILEGAVISMSSRLLSRREELTELAQQLGCRVLPRIDVKETTHLVHQSNRERETLRDYQLALQNRIHVVSPWWLYECRDTMMAVPEDSFPYTYNRDRRLMLVSTSQAPPKQQLGEGLVTGPSSSRWQISPSLGNPVNAKGKQEYSVHAAASLVDTTNPGLLVQQELRSAPATNTHEIGSIFGKKAATTQRKYRRTMDGVEHELSGILEKEAQAQKMAISCSSASASSGGNALDQLDEARGQMARLQPHYADKVSNGKAIIPRAGATVEDADTQMPDKWWLSVDPVTSARYAAEFQASMYSQDSPPSDCHILDSVPCTSAPADDVGSCTSSRIESLGPHVRHRSASASVSSPQPVHNTTIVYGEDAEALSERDQLIQRLIRR